ncbi:type II secretion system F family protein [Roseomonas elaeocarpi]|uniref:Type II secretion system F family protein n=1 Tax=Roseomonas elaeocarpi TaxID=907779 RepID=A0ABV6JSX7_9PROT
MERLFLPALLAVLSLAMLLWAAVILRSGLRQRLRNRVLAVGVRAREAAPEARALNIRREMARRGALSRLATKLFLYDPANAREQILPWPAVLAAALVLAAFGWWRGRVLLGDGLGMLAGMLSAGWAARSFFRWQHRRYCDALFLQIPDAVGLMLRALRAGLPMGEAVRSLAREMPQPTRDEFAGVVGVMALGQPVEAGLWQLYHRTRLTEYAFLAVTLGLQSQTGGSLAETLDNLGDMVRKRIAMAAKARAVAGEARASATILIALPFVAGLALSLLRPGYMNVFFTTDLGSKLLVLGLSLVGAGVMTIRWLIRRSTAD